MHYKLYIDVLFLENFMMDSLILLAIRKILALRQPAARSFLGGAVGSLLTCIVMAVPIPPGIKQFLFHCVINMVMLSAGLKFGSRRQFAQAFMLLYLCSIVLGGMMQLFRPWLRGISLFYGCAVFCWHIWMQGWNLLTCFAERRKKILDVLLYIKGQKISVRALADTGNSLTDLLTGDPVSIVRSEIYDKIRQIPSEQGPDKVNRAEELICKKISHEMNENTERADRENKVSADPTKDRADTEKEKFRYIPYQCISGKGIMKVIRIEKMCVFGTEEMWVDHPLIGISEEPFGTEEEYQMILNQQYIK